MKILLKKLISGNNNQIILSEKVQKLSVPINLMVRFYYFS